MAFKQSFLTEVCPNETPVASYISETLRKHKLTSKCIAFNEDNATVTFGGTAGRTRKLDVLH